MLTPDEIKQITAAVKAAHGDFYIEAKDHYDTHKRLDRLLGIWDRCESEAWKFVIGMFIFAGIIVSAVWSAFHK